MANLFLMPGGAVGEAAYDTLTKSTGAGQSQAWNNSPALNGESGDVTFTVANTNNVFATKEDLDFTTAPALMVTGWIDATDMTFTGNALFGICVVSLASAAVNAHRIGVAYSYTHTGTVHALLFQKVDDGGSGLNNTIPITNAPHKFGYRFQRATTAVASDGRADYYIDDALVASRTGLDNYDDFALLEWLQIGNAGKMSGLDATATGPLHMGKIGINDTGDQIVFPASPGMRHTLNRRRRKSYCW